VDPFELFAAETVRNESNPKAQVVRHLQQESRGADFLVLWLDCDREGENICFEVCPRGAGGACCRRIWRTVRRRRRSCAVGARWLGAGVPSPRAARGLALKRLQSQQGADASHPTGWRSAPLEASKPSAATLPTDLPPPPTL
jgi:hypothetical protein